MTSRRLPFSQASENNKQPILQVLSQVLTEPGLVLEIGTGTGQHAVHFAAAMPHLTWLPSDHPKAIANSYLRLREAGLSNIAEPFALDVTQVPWPLDRADAVFSANTAHIMAWQGVEAMFTGAARLLRTNQPFCLYGPFNVGGRYTSDGNRSFDHHLKNQNPDMGLRDLDDLVVLAAAAGLGLADDLAMPANNRLLVWRKHRPV